jgi:hypothetical protein
MDKAGSATAPSISALRPLYPQPPPQKGTFSLCSTRGHSHFALTEPFCCCVLHLLDVCEQVLAEPFVPHCSVVAFDIGVLLRLAGLVVNAGEPSREIICILPRPRASGQLLALQGAVGPVFMTGLCGLAPKFHPPCAPEPQPAETLWTLVDEPLVNKHIPTLEDLEDIVAKRCVDLAAERAAIKAKTGFRWWPNIVKPN